MIRASVLLVLLLAALLGASYASAQSDCGSGLPCGPIPWRLPVLPRLASPTPFPTIGATATPSVSPTPSVTPTPGSIIPMTPIDTGDLDDQMGTLQAVINSTTMPVTDFNGTPVDTSAQFDNLGNNAGTFFGYARSLSGAAFGSLSPLIVFAIAAFLTVVSVKLLAFFLPVITAAFGVIRKVISLILDFLPF